MLWYSVYLYYTALLNNADCRWVQIFNKVFKCLIYVGYWEMKHWKCLVSEKDAKAIGGTNVCKAEEVRKCFVNSKIELKFQLVCKLHYLQLEFQKYLMNTLFITYENDEWRHFVVRIDSSALISFYCVCFVSFYFFLFFLFFCGFYYLLRY